MITIPTTLVLGAGASAPYGFPIGSALVQQILNPNDHDCRQLNELGIPDGAIQEFINELRTAEPPSIDFFLEHRPEFLDIGRYRISQQLIKCEDLDKLNSCAPSQHWYKYFVDKITAAPERMLDNTVKIITFNYDRSFETYLYQTLHSRFHKDMLPFIESLQINHVHGKLASPHWEFGTASKRHYSPLCGIGELKAAAEGLKIIFEVDGSSAEFIAAKKTIEESERVYFLGFGYHEESLQRLGFPLAMPTQLNRLPKKVNGSTFGFSGPEIHAIMKNWGVFDGNCGNNGHAALQFLRECNEQFDKKPE